MTTLPDKTLHADPSFYEMPNTTFFSRMSESLYPWKS